MQVAGHWQDPLSIFMTCSFSDLLAHVTSVLGQGRCVQPTNGPSSKTEALVVLRQLLPRLLRPMAAAARGSPVCCVSKRAGRSSSADIFASTARRSLCCAEPVSPRITRARSSSVSCVAAAPLTKGGTKRAAPTSLGGALCRAMVQLLARARCPASCHAPRKQPVRTAPRARPESAAGPSDI